MEQTRCSTLLISSDMAAVARHIITTSHQSLDFMVIPTFEEMMESTPAPFLYSKDFESAKNDPILVLHTSGSTGKSRKVCRTQLTQPGMPRSVCLTHRCFATLDNDHNIVPIPSRKKHDFTLWDFNGGGKFYAPFPCYHVCILRLTIRSLLLTHHSLQDLSCWQVRLAISSRLVCI